MTSHRFGPLAVFCAALATAGCGAGRTPAPSQLGSIETRVASAPQAVKAILVAVSGAGIASPMTTTLSSDQNGHWTGRVLNVPPGTLRTVTAYAYDTLTLPADPEVDTAGLIFRGASTNVTVTAGLLTGVTVPLLPWPDGGGGFGVNTPPHITSVGHPTAMASNGSATFTATAVDPDSGATLTYQWTDTAGGTFSGGDVASPWIFSNVAPGDAVSVGYTPPTGFVGTTTIRVFVFDGTATATTTFPVGIGSGIDVGLVFDVLPEILLLAASSQELLQGGTSIIDWTLLYPSGTGPDAPTTLEVTTAWADSCGGGFSPATGSFTVVDGVPVGTQLVTYTAPVTGDVTVAQCDLTLTVTDLHGAEVFSKVIVWVNPGAAPVGGKVVFVTSYGTDAAQGGTNQVQANFFNGDAAIADAFCTSMARSGSGPNRPPAGTYLAFLSVDGQNAGDRLPAGPYHLADGTLVALDKADLLDGSILHAIDMDESGLVAASSLEVWTGANADGSPSGQDCSNWTVATDFSPGGAAGTTGSTGGAWAYWMGSFWCSDRKSVYCFQQ